MNRKTNPAFVGKSGAKIVERNGDDEYLKQVAEFMLSEDSYLEVLYFRTSDVQRLR